MLLAYLDESFTKERYYICAVVVPDDVARPLADALDGVVWDASRAFDVSSRAELHGHPLMQGKGDWAALKDKIRARVGIYEDAMTAIGAHEVHIVCCGVDVDRLKARYGVAADPPHKVVLQHVLERVDRLARKAGQNALIVADEVSEEDQHQRDLWMYQRGGTPGYLSSDLASIVDTIHFVPSHASRLLQAADLVAYMHRRRQAHADTDPRALETKERLWKPIEDRIRFERLWVP